MEIIKTVEQRLNNIIDTLFESSMNDDMSNVLFERVAKLAEELKTTKNQGLIIAQIPALDYAIYNQITALRRYNELLISQIAELDGLNTLLNEVTDEVDVLSLQSLLDIQKHEFYALVEINDTLLEKFKHIRLSVFPSWTRHLEVANASHLIELETNHLNSLLKDLKKEARVEVTEYNAKHLIEHADESSEEVRRLQKSIEQKKKKLERLLK